MATKSTGRRKSVDIDANLKLLCSTLLAEREELRNELTKVRAENDQLKRSLGAVLCKNLPVNKRITPSDAAEEPPIAEVIAELERAGA